MISILGAVLAAAFFGTAGIELLGHRNAPVSVLQLRGEIAQHPEKDFRACLEKAIRRWNVLNVGELALCEDQSRESAPSPLGRQQLQVLTSAPLQR